MNKSTGHHHISMITKDIKENNHFYTKVLGLRRVKVSVNQDDPSMYHLFYGDKIGSPGMDLTFFEMPMVGRTYRGTNAITGIGLLLSSLESLTYWKNRFEKFSVPHSDIIEVGSRKIMNFTDPDGLQLSLIYAAGQTLPSWQAWEKSAVPTEHQIKGMGTIEITVKRVEKLVRTMTEIFNYTVVSQNKDEAVLQAVGGEVYGEIKIKYLDGPKEKPGRGSIHHLAIRAKDETQLRHWDQLVKYRGFFSSGILDRFYFKSVYFRESNGIVFELATDGPGFTVDSAVRDLGKKLDLPPFLENRRKEIEAKLLPLEEMK